jgi:hypothetical protein
MLTVELPAAEATLTAALESLGLDPDEVDHEFGLVPIDAAQGKYVIVVSEAAGARATGTGDAQGPYANPPIEPFGPPRTGEDEAP